MLDSSEREFWNFVQFTSLPKISSSFIVMVGDLGTPSAVPAPTCCISGCISLFFAAVLHLASVSTLPTWQVWYVNVCMPA